jgi:hypothetical protein
MKISALPLLRIEISSRGNWHEKKYFAMLDTLIVFVDGFCADIR